MGDFSRLLQVPPGRRTVEEALSPEPWVTGQWKEGLYEGLVPAGRLLAKETHVTMTRTRWPALVTAPT